MSDEGAFSPEYTSPCDILIGIAGELVEIPPKLLLGICWYVDCFFDLEPCQDAYLLEKIAQLGLREQVHAEFHQDHLEPETCARYRDMDAIAVFVWTKVSRTILEQLPNLKLVLTMSTGYDHIDIEACQERGIVVCNVPHYGENTVAEHTFALILALSRKIRQAQGWLMHPSRSIAELRGFDLYCTGG